MKTIRILMLALTLTTIGSYAQKRTYTKATKETIYLGDAIQFNNKTVIINTYTDQTEVYVLADPANEYKQVFEGRYSNDKVSEKWNVLDELAFIKKNHDHSKMQSHWGGLGFGLANVTNHFLDLTPINGFNLNAIQSHEIFFNFYKHIIPIIGNNVGISTGMGFDWRNYHFADNVHLAVTNDQATLLPAPEGINYKYSRLRTVYFTIPLLLEIQPSFQGNHDSYLAAGVVGGIKTLSSSKVKYEDAEGHSIRNVVGRGLKVNTFTWEYIAMAGVDNTSIYAKYSPMGIFQDGKGPDCKAMSVGLVLGF